jgi:TATA-binding protein-associated factor Taf7
MESHKTINNKTFYKIADICQLIFKEGEDFDDEEDANSPVKKKKDPNKVDKKWHWTSPDKLYKEKIQEEMEEEVGIVVV